MDNRYMKPGLPGFYRKNKKGDEYRCCEANVYTDRYKQETRPCNAAALKGTRLCSRHKKMRNQIENAYIWCIQLSKKGDKYLSDKYGMRKWPKYYIAKRFHSLEQAQLWANLNSNLIFNIPRVKSFCIVRFKI